MRISDWSSDVCSSDLGNYLNFVFPLTPELATVDINPGICDNVEEGSRGRTRPTQVHVLPGLDGLVIDYPLRTGDMDVGAGPASEGRDAPKDQEQQAGNRGPSTARSSTPPGGSPEVCPRWLWRESSQPTSALSAT